MLGVLQWASELRTLRPDRTFTKDSSAYSTILTANNRRFGQPASSNRNDTVGVESRDVTTSLERADENGALARSTHHRVSEVSECVIFVYVIIINYDIMTRTTKHTRGHATSPTKSSPDARHAHPARPARPARLPTPSNARTHACVKPLAYLTSRKHIDSCKHTHLLPQEPWTTTASHSTLSAPSAIS